MIKTYNRKGRDIREENIRQLRKWQKKEEIKRKIYDNCASDRKRGDFLKKENIR